MAKSHRFRKSKKNKNSKRNKTSRRKIKGGLYSHFASKKYLELKEDLFPISIKSCKNNNQYAESQFTCVITTLFTSIANCQRSNSNTEKQNQLIEITKILNFLAGDTHISCSTYIRRSKCTDAKIVGYTNIIGSLDRILLLTQHLVMTQPEVNKYTSYEVENLGELINFIETYILEPKIAVEEEETNDILMNLLKSILAIYDKIVMKNKYKIRISDNYKLCEYIIRDIRNYISFKDNSYIQNNKYNKYVHNYLKKNIKNFLKNIIYRIIYYNIIKKHKNSFNEKTNSATSKGEYHLEDQIIIKRREEYDNSDEGKAAAAAAAEADEATENKTEKKLTIPDILKPIISKCTDLTYDLAIFRCIVNQLQFKIDSCKEEQNYLNIKTYIEHITEILKFLGENDFVCSTNKCKRDTQILHLSIYKQLNDIILLTQPLIMTKEDINSETKKTDYDIFIGFVNDSRDNRERIFRIDQKLTQAEFLQSDDDIVGILLLNLLESISKYYKKINYTYINKEEDTNNYIFCYSSEYPENCITDSIRDYIDIYKNQYSNWIPMYLQKRLKNFLINIIRRINFIRELYKKSNFDFKKYTDLNPGSEIQYLNVEEKDVLIDNIREYNERVTEPNKEPTDSKYFLEIFLGKIIRWRLSYKKALHDSEQAKITKSDTPIFSNRFLGYNMQ